jgi:hypothetical protein
MHMRRFRTQWLALFGALVILSLSLGSAFGARPTKADGESLTFGQQVSAFVHSLQSADQDEDQDEDADEDADQDDADDEDSGDTEDTDGSEDSNHGHCVAEVAHDPEAVGENGTHGWAVSLAARVTCWQEFADPDNGDTDEDSEDSEEPTDESDASPDGADADKPHGKSAEAHQRKQDRGSGKPSWAGANAGGHGHGHGHGNGGPHH